MGLFGSSSSSNPADDGIAPNRSQRAICWEARDAFFACLDSHSIVDSTLPEGSAIARKACGKEVKEFEKQCKASWVEYFQKKRVMERKKEDMIKKLAEEKAKKIE